MTDESAKVFDLSVDCTQFCNGGQISAEETGYPDEQSWVRYPDHAAAVAALQARVRELEDAIIRQANAVKTLDACRLRISSVALAAAKKLNSESNPGGLEAERQVNERLTNELEAVEAERDRLLLDNQDLRNTLSAIAEQVGPSPELPEPHRTPAKAYALIGWYQHASEHLALKVVRFERQNKALLDCLINIREYWNGDKNEQAMADALEHIVSSLEHIVSSADDAIANNAVKGE